MRSHLHGFVYIDFRMSEQRFHDFHIGLHTRTGCQQRWVAPLQKQKTRKKHKVKNTVDQEKK